MTIRINASIESQWRSAKAGPAIRRWVRLFLIELRRSPAIWAALAIALLTWWLMRSGMRVGVVRWRDISAVAGDPMIPASGIATGLAAFVAGREYRSHMIEQVHATSIGRLSRDLAVAMSVLVWCLLGYGSVVAAYFAYAVNGATWGGPTWGFVMIPLASIGTSVAIGWLIGILVRNRLSPLLALGLVSVLHAVYPMTQRFRMLDEVMPNGVMSQRGAVTWWRLLIPWEMLDFAAVFGVVAFGTIWLAGLAVLLWCLSIWWKYQSGAAVVGAALGLVIAVGSASGLVSGEWSLPRSGYVEPMCTTRFDGQISICVHPQDAALLDQSAGVIADVLSPLKGVSELPVNYVEMQDERVGDGAVSFSLYDQTTITNLHLHQTILREVLQGQSSFSGRIGSAQYVIAAWLLAEAGISPQAVEQGELLMPLRRVYGTDADRKAGVTDPMAFGHQGPSPDEFAAFKADIHSAIDRFSALSPAQQRAWLEANWAALRAGELTLVDMP